MKITILGVDSSLSIEADDDGEDVYLDAFYVDDDGDLDKKRPRIRTSFDRRELVEALVAAGILKRAALDHVITSGVER